MNPKVIFTTIVCSLLCLSAYSQVTVGSSEPPQEGALLQIKEVDGVQTKGRNAFGGLSLPRVFLSSTNNLYPMFLSTPDVSTSGPTSAYNLNKATLDAQHTGLVVYNVNNATPFSEGLYVWTGQAWTPMGGVMGTNGLANLAAGEVGLGGALNKATVIETGTTAQPYSLAFVNGKDSVRIGTVAGSSAVFKISSTNKGVLLPTVTLSSRTDQTTVPNPELGLMVYNTGKHASYSVEGFFFWNGSEWKTLDNSIAIQPSFAALSCASAVLSPPQYTNGTAYSGVLRVPYIGGNGGRYNGGASVTVNGLTFRLQDGKLENGNGEIVFSVSGTPNVTSPTPTTIVMAKALVPFNAGSVCNVVVGDNVDATVRTKATVGPLLKTNEGAAGYHRVVTTPDGKYSVRVFIRTGQGLDKADLQIRNNKSSTESIMWSSNFAWNDDSKGYSNNKLELRPNIWSGNNNSNVGLSNSGTTVEQSSSNDAAWGDPDVYYKDSPEHRSYMWISHDPNSQTAYILTFMMGARSLGTVDDARAATVKAFLKIDEVLANE
ncbi:MAG: hypothetical protein LBD28_05105 [Tannerellaceae bacterium]|jgi:hypothetical protein|nr:hypothetical protein [Tannerellaceae bacterium]